MKKKIGPSEPLLHALDVIKNLNNVKCERCGGSFNERKVKKVDLEFDLGRGCSSPVCSVNMCTSCTKEVEVFMKKKGN
jgi:DNA-directed RNA polymerase subunit RPC12/RpoP